MVLWDTLKNRTESLLMTPGQEMGRWARFVRFQIQLWKFCMRRLRQNNAMAMSSALSFRTIFTLIPTLVLAILVMKTLGYQQEAKANLLKLLETSGIAQISLTQDSSVEPDTQIEQQTPPAQQTQPELQQGSSIDQINAADYIIELVDRVENKLTIGRVGPVGIALFIWTAITLLTTIERSLNRIYGARFSRGIVRRMMLYWSVITLMPILMTAATYLFNLAAGFFAETPVLSWILKITDWAGTLIVGMLLLAAVYKMMPNTKILYRAAFGGAVSALPLWLIARWAFALYINKVAGSSLYGILGLLPLFLMWLNLSWLIFLFGAELSNTATGLSRMQSEELADKTILGPSELMATTIAVAQDFTTGKGPAFFDSIADRLNLPNISVQRLLDRLQLKNVICPIESEKNAGYVLTRPPDQIEVLDILDIGDTNNKTASKAAYDPQIADKVNRINQQAQATLGNMTLSDIIK
ncbi:MAG: YihY family inner membrane protein [Planctomycetes bacterium]|nr:YihY family inner membrane protein [Planctomycetota bacterium]